MPAAGRRKMLYFLSSDPPEYCLSFIIPKWPVPENVFSRISTRKAGVSEGAYASFNVAQHVGDNKARVAINRQQLEQEIALSMEASWLNQVHGIEVTRLPGGPLTADAAITTTINTVCVVMTADCLPVLLCNQSGTEVGAVHAGWKGLAAGVLETTLNEMHSKPAALLAYLGPAISQTYFEVGAEVRTCFVNLDKNHEQAFSASGRPQHYLADLYLLARQKLMRLGVKQIYGGQYCTYQEQDLFYSYRRDQGVTGRMASLIYFT